ncbi:hypothetical protein Z042_19115 [Chania multitudinisentens RB-25]|uniref:Cytoplasmic protein n=1 Tax=Chania multitudinisentens RB-25 TaxID=1441930 RepID=W0LGH2_9GAMM|nr:DUF1493 family protein [Chania multitudinisentens]AHG21484.1 hypothetical protein Z042_19115 [Chania multitudinisentens RB-25]
MELKPQSDDIGQQVFDWYDKKWNLRTPFSKKKPLTLDTSLSTGKYPWIWEDGLEIMEEYFELFKVDITGFNFMKYWPQEISIISALLSLLKPRSKCNKNQEPEPLTIRMLIESAKAGRWLYD